MDAGASLETCCDAISKFEGVPGRLQNVANQKGINVFIDYAHTDDALKAVLSALNSIRKETKSDCKLITVFGCGGDRDKGKRPLMAKAAVSLSDLVVLTSDNPRNEDPEEIMKGALSGIDPDQIGKRVFIEVERKKGIEKAIELADKGDVVVICGKGHETFQQIGSEYIHFDDYETAKEILS